MASSKKDDAVVTTHPDHDVIVPPNRLRKAVLQQTPGARDDASDPVARAEQALAALSENFSDWMDSECRRLDAARIAIRDTGLSRHTREAVFHAAHDIKGEAETFGFPFAAAAAASLCHLLEGIPPGQPIPQILIDQHVDAVKAIVREHAEPYAERMAIRLTERLENVTAAYLLSISDAA